jgi:hypothetical protein
MAVNGERRDLLTLITTAIKKIFAEPKDLLWAIKNK